MDMRPPMMDRGGNRSADRPGDERRAHRSEGVRQRRRGMMDHYGSTPQRGERRDFRSGENEMRAPTPPPHRGPQFDRMSPDRGPDRMERPREMMKPRPEFRPEARGDQGPRSDFHRPPSRDDRGPHREGPPPCGWDGDQRRSN